MRKGLLFLYTVGGIALIGLAQSKVGSIKLNPLGILTVAFITLSLIGMIIICKKMQGTPANG